MSAATKSPQSRDPAISGELSKTKARDKSPKRWRTGLAALGLTVVLAVAAYFALGVPERDAVQMGRLNMGSAHHELVSLSGDWEVLEDSNAPTGTSAGYARLPVKWANPYGHAFYRLHIRGLDPGLAYAVRTSCLDTSYRLSVNGQVFMSGGEPGQSPATTRPALSPGVAVLPQGLGDADLVLEVANFVHFRGGPSLPILFGEAGAVKDYDAWSIGSDMLSIVVLLFLFCCAAMSAGFRRNLSSLYYGLICLTGAFAFLLISPEFLVFRIDPGFDWSLYVKLSFFVCYSSALWFMLTARSLFGGLSNRSTLLLSAPTFFLGLVVLILPPDIFTRANPLFMLNNLVLAAVSVLLFARAVSKAYPYARILSLGFALMLFGAASFLFFSDSTFTGPGFFLLSALQPLAESFGVSRLNLDLVSYALNLLGLTVFSVVFFMDAPKLECLPPVRSEASGHERYRARCASMALTPRETEVTLLLLDGKRNKEIASALGVSENTVKTLLSRIFAKTGVKARSELFAIFLQG